MVTTIWEDPPPSHRRSGRPNTVWAERLLPLMERPGEWARLYDGSFGSARATANYLRVRRHLDGRWEFVSRKTEDGGRVYARYLGPDE